LKKRSKQNNPEQKTKNAENSVEMGAEYDPVKEVKQKNLKRAQPVKSKNHSENE
jgi:hypothetical protein